MLQFARASESFLERPAISETTAVWLNDAPKEAATPRTPVTPARHALDDARFIPGDIVAGRYRIAGLLGRGGMGEVYRADDLKLGQPVALKFLAESLASNGAALARFHREVSLARQISHRHVCRVYDIGEHAGMHFLSMEYVRGEELASLLKRIGRLPLDKGLQTARQLCAGLAAIHAAGVLHRDLKPANVMIDEHGDVRITDFGIAALAEGVAGSEATIGTPVYMSPEQLSGGEVTTRSDLYALGLVLYEIFTGKRPFTGTTLPDVVRARLGDTAPTHPSEWIPDLDPLVERTILRCLAKDPQRRPATALQVAAGLPGGDPLAAALAAGETPSPQMVAAAAAEGSLRPAQAMMLLLAIVAGMALTAFWSRTSLHRMVPLELSPEVLRARAREIAEEAGYRARPADSVGGFRIDAGAVQFVETHDRPPDRRTRLRTGLPSALYFWHRESPRQLEPYEASNVDEHDPPNSLAGMLLMRLDTEGRLLYFEAAPPQAETRPAATRTVDWNRMFARAGLSPAAFRPATPRWTPPHYGDARFAWTGTHPQRPELPLRIEAASYRGAPAYFEVVRPWQKPARDAAPLSLARDPLSIALLTLYFGTMALAALLAWRNLRLGRGDRRGTFRLMLFTFCSRMLYLIVTPHHVAGAGEVNVIVTGLQSAIYWAALIGLLYLALEPLVRRRWPEGLISWSRLLAGNFRDALVGRHVLIGGALGIATILTWQLLLVLPPFLGMPAPPPSWGSPLLYTHGLAGTRGFLPLLINQISASILFPLIITAVVLFFGMFTRRKAVAIGASWIALYAVLALRFSDGTAVSYVLGLIVPTLMIVALTRYGLLTLSSMFFFIHLWSFYPATTDLSAWYATTYLLQLAVLTAVTLFAFRVALAGQKVFEGAILDG